MKRDAMIAEVMRRVGTRIGPSDPICAVVEMNRMFLEESVDALLERTAPLANRISDAGVEMAKRLGVTGTRQILETLKDARESIAEEAQSARSAIATEASDARNAAAIAIRQVATSHRRADTAQWVCVALAVAFAMAGSAFAAGYYFAPSINDVPVCKIVR